AMVAGRQGGELAPLAITGQRLHGIRYVSPVASAQVKSALLLAGLFAEGTTEFQEPNLSRDHTERMFQSFGIPLKKNGTTVTLQGGGRVGGSRIGWSGRSIAIPGDFSSAAFLIVGATIVPQSDVTLLNVGVNPTRIGLIEVLQRMGADIRVLRQWNEGGEPVADLRVKSAPLTGVTIGPDLVPQTIDEFPILCVAAAVAEGETVISGAEELRVKESDRIATMAAELRAMGARVYEKPDGLAIDGLGGKGENGRLTASTVVHSHGDHRVAMSLAIGGLTAQAPTTIVDSRCIETSFPNFESLLTRLLTGEEGKL
ncbi:MAG: 3-phosphoshikimate 1-carboxyvinyltransferase, partial [Nitrospira sp.]